MENVSRYNSLQKIDFVKSFFLTNYKIYNNYKFNKNCKDGTFCKKETSMDVMTVSQASDYCKVSPKTIINWIEAGHIKAYKTVGGHRRIKKGGFRSILEGEGDAHS